MRQFSRLGSVWFHPKQTMDASTRPAVASLVTLILFTTLSGCALEPPLPRDHDELSEVTETTLRQFSDKAEFDQYVSRVYEIATDQGFWWAFQRGQSSSTLLVQNDAVDGCDPADEGCNELAEIAVTAAKRASSNASQSITNNQEKGVDEGDIVKHYKNFLIVLQHGRLFSVDLGADAATLSFVDRVDIYTNSEDWTWYDELLVSGNKLIVTGFNYNEDATEITVFEISESGVFTLLTTYLITSQDYYSSNNYATRLVDGHLVIYTPLYLFEYGIDEGVIFPIYRQRTPDGQDSGWLPLFGPTDIFWPIQDTFQPVVHTISVCPMTIDGALACSSTGIVGPAHREFYVSPEHAYIWNSEDIYELWEQDSRVDECSELPDVSNYEPLASALFRIPLFGGKTKALKTFGIPPDQFSLDARESSFHALLSWVPRNCWMVDERPMRYIRIGNDEFLQTPKTIVNSRFAKLPLSRGYGLQNRFSEEYVAYTDTVNYESGGKWLERSDIIAAPLNNPSQTFRIPLEHNAERLEVFGNGLVVNGYTYGDGLFLSTLSLGKWPHVSDKEYLADYFESEGRSHAFNLVVDEDGSGVFGVPVTVTIPYYRWRRLRENSDIAFFSVDSMMNMSSAGLLNSTTNLDEQGYECEVSCYDWYGNARPIFIHGRIFALSGSELIEGAIQDGKIADLGRLSLMSAPENFRSQRSAVK